MSENLKKEPNQMSPDDIIRFRKIVRDYLELDDQVRILSRAKRTRIQKRDLLGKFIMETLKSNQLEVIRLQKMEERLELVKIERKTPINHPFLRDKLNSFYGSNKKEAQKLYSFFLENRDSKINYRLKRIKEGKPLSPLIQNPIPNIQKEEIQKEEIPKEEIPKEEIPKEEIQKEEIENINYHDFLKESLKEWETDSQRSTTYETTDEEDIDYDDEIDNIPEEDTMIPNEITEELLNKKLPEPTIDYRREVFDKLNKISSQQMSNFRIPSQIKNLQSGGKILENTSRK